ncbi:3-phosphoshikimate 1-carboxyvinyltransferase [archaeon BMS3Abin17]|nr:3-phosphoshikimate 1-carboxyvinyltransferase [archaeon BMS3Abin17]HDZ60559.1 hypothetical protein [Candidatus Pacearchaeota archaeon]
MEEINRFIPLDKSWIIRIGVLDLVNGYRDIIDFLNKQERLSDDLLALKTAIIEWNKKKQINVGESGTLYRFLKFTSWKLGLNKGFIKHLTLKNRKICDNPEIISWNLRQLLELDNKTSQWASASVLLGNTEKIENPPFKLQITYDAIHHWKSQREKKLSWEPKYDETIKNQALAFINLLKTGGINFQPQQPEDYCFARAFNLITPEEGEEKWSSLRFHESDRIKEMEKSIQQMHNNEIIDSKDHRVVQAIAMSSKAKNKSVKFEFPECVNKSWPQFWDFIEGCN